MDEARRGGVAPDQPRVDFRRFPRAEFTLQELEGGTMSQLIDAPRRGDDVGEEAHAFQGLLPFILANVRSFPAPRPHQLLNILQRDQESARPDLGIGFPSRLKRLLEGFRVGFLNHEMGRPDGQRRTEKEVFRKVESRESPAGFFEGVLQTAGFFRCDRAGRLRDAAVNHVVHVDAPLERREGNQLRRAPLRRGAGAAGALYDVDAVVGDAGMNRPVMQRFRGTGPGRHVQHGS
jgi:hypothetical protein